FFKESGARSAKGSFNSEHKKEGEWVHWHENGVVESRSHYANDEETGVYRSWYEDGAERDSVRLEKDITQGLFTSRDRAGLVRSRRTMTDGKATGPASYYHRCDALKLACVNTDDKANGTVTSFFPDGSKEWVGNLKDDRRHGIVEDFYPNGQLRLHGEYVNGDRTGPFTEYYASGKKKTESNHVKGKLSGKRTVWYAHGGISEEENYDEQGREQGIHRTYTDDGKLYSEFEYTKGLLVRYRYFDVDGELLGEGKRSAGRFNFKGFYAEGAVRMEGAYLDEGAKDGTWKWYWSDGTLQSEEVFKAGAWNGVKRRFDRIGRKTTEYRMQEGFATTGPYTTFHPDGSVSMQGNFEDGNYSGEFVSYEPDGKLASETYYAD
ncbi:MAG TPA: hypothetical protein PK760_15005, partial [Flavobacteriales bacterium]|nr:hypothetical protein [Flavobacteriales bacterium]